MAIRALYTDVQTLMETDLTQTQIEAFIRTANLLVENNLADESSLDDDTLTEIERYLACHFCALRDQRASRESASSVSISYQFKVGLRLEYSSYGQQALLLDHTGILHNLNKGKQRASLSFIGGDLSAKLT